jgi:hypothetical protein
VAYVDHPLKAERIEQAQQVVGEVLLLVTVVRSARPAVAAKIGHQAAVLVGEQGCDPIPAPPVLRPAVYQ